MQYTLKELSQRIDCDESFLSKVEHGERNISLSKLSKISDILKIPLEFFITDKEYSIAAYGRSNNSKDKEMQILISELNLIAYNVDYLAGILNVNLCYNGPRDKYNREVTDKLINEIKINLSLPDIIDYTTLSEQLTEKWKVMIFEIPLKFDDLSGLTLKYNDKIVIFINENHTSERKLFSLAHEIGHLILHNNQNLSVLLSRNDEREKDANKFAEMFLIPSKLFYDQLSLSSTALNRKNIDNLAKYFKVSYDCMFYKLRSKGLVAYWDKNISPKKHNKNKDLEHFTFKDYPLDYAVLIWAALKNKKISFSKASEILKCTIQETEEFYEMLNFFNKISERINDSNI